MREGKIEGGPRASQLYSMCAKSSVVPTSFTMHLQGDCKLLQQEEINKHYCYYYHRKSLFQDWNWPCSSYERVMKRSLVWLQRKHLELEEIHTVFIPLGELFPLALHCSSSSQCSMWITTTR